MAFFNPQNLSSPNKTQELQNRIPNNQKITMMEIIVSVILLFLGIAVLVIIHICVKSGFVNPSGSAEDQRIVHRATKRRSACGLSVEDLKTIPWFDYKEGEKGESCDVDCAVCLESFKVGDNCRRLPRCHHLFHLECVDLWLMKKPFCPVCRASVRPMKKKVIGYQSNGSGLGADELV